MGPRELLPLRLPLTDDPAADGLTSTDGEPDDDQPVQESIAANEPPASFDDLQPFRRGPEITERR
jgi:hypothetical protein